MLGIVCTVTSQVVVNKLSQEEVEVGIKMNRGRLGKVIVRRMASVSYITIINASAATVPMQFLIAPNLYLRYRTHKNHLNGFKHPIPNHVDPSYTGALKPEAWKKYLPSDYVGYYLMDGIQYGFKLVNSDGFQSIDQDNYSSATTNNATAVEKQILEEIIEL